MMPTNGPQFIFAQLEVLKNLQNAYSQASEALGSSLGLCPLDSLEPIQAHFVLIVEST